MKCEFFKETPRLRCTIHKERLYVPSALQQKKLCISRGHCSCPYSA